MVGNTEDRLREITRYLVYLMKDTIPDHILQKVIDILDQCALALRFYTATKQDKYLDELTWAVRRLNQLFNEKGESHE